MWAAAWFVVGGMVGMILMACVTVYHDEREGE